MFIGRNRCAERHISEVLQCIGERVIRGIAAFPKTIALSKLFGCERRQSQKVIGAVFDHINAEIVAGVDAKVRPQFVAQHQPLEFLHAIQRRMFQSLQLRDIQKSTHCLVVENLTVWRKHLSEFETKNLPIATTCRAVGRNLLARFSAVKPRSLKDDRRAAASNDLVAARAILREGVEAQREVALGLAGMKPTCQGLTDALADFAVSDLIRGGEETIGALAWAGGRYLDDGLDTPTPTIPTRYDAS